MKTSKLGTALGGAFLLVGVISTGCVADRPSRNGVFDENQYLRKDFLIQGTDANGNAAGSDPGWLMHTTVTETSTPNLLGSYYGFSIWGGLQTPVDLVRFRVTQDKVQLLSQIQLSSPQNPDPTTGAPGPANNTAVTEAVENAWPATNVDLKYQVNLDGEKTNFYQENQELDWQVRQWVKLNFDKNDLSDLESLGYASNDLLDKCADVVDISSTLVANSINVESGGPGNTANDYFEFTVQVTVPLMFDDPTCITAYGSALANAAKIQPQGRSTVTVNLKYSFKRALPLTDPASTYKPLVIGEKDPIHTKYGPIMLTVFNRDNQSQLMAATQYVERFDPAKPIVWYFEQGFPEYYKPVFLGTAGNACAPAATCPGIMQGTNTVLTAAGAAARVTFLNYNDQTTYGDGAGPARAYGDIRYNFLRWVSDLDTEDGFSAVTMNDGVDPRTGEVINQAIEYNDQAVKDYFSQRIDAFLQTVGASAGLGNSGWATGSCTTGATKQIVNQTVVDNHNANSTLYVKMQSYLGLHGPDPKDDHLGPQDFVAVQDQDFFNAYFAIAPYEIFADPDMNAFVTREGGQGVYGPAAHWAALQQETQFRNLTAAINNGQTPYDGSTGGTTGTLNAADFANQMRDATTGHHQLKLINLMTHPGVFMDAPGAFSFETVMEQDSQLCVNGTWETQDQWSQHIIDAWWQQVFWHEFGHGMGLDHNFMGSIDQPNFVTQRDASGKPLTDANGNPLYTMYTSTVMEYNATPANAAWTQGWGTYDKGAIAWIYANDTRQPDDPTKDAQAIANKSRSGEVAGAAAGQEYPWKDPLGFCGQVNGKADPDCTAGQERQFLRCDATHLKYSPLCRQEDLGTTPSQIIANAIDAYEWQYQWRNFRDYRKVWDESAYATAVDGFISDQKRFLSQWEFDWTPGDLATVLYRVGIQPPASAPSAVDYYSQLTQKFLTEMSKANQMVAAFDEAIIQQTAGERPYATVYDKFYGDVTQQGIILDKYFAMQDFVGLWPSDNYDQNQAGKYISTWGEFDFDTSFQSVAETAVTSMVGSQYSVYPYFIPTAVALFAQDTHNPAVLENGNSGAGTTGDRIEAKDWIGGWVFTDTSFLINFFRNLAVSVQGPLASQGLPMCATFSSCTYDVTDPSQVPKDPNDGHFVGPDGLTYIYMYVPSRNQWVLARQNANVATYKVIEAYNADLIGSRDDGTNGLYGLEYQVKYTIDAYQTYESQPQ